jgi:DNA-binding response OmpR family regulator
VESILIVEDDPAILLGLEDLLAGEGYSVDCARDGRKALEQYGKHKPDLVLLDVMIPELSGYEVCRQIRKSDALTPILMLTAKGQEPDKVAGLELGADDYVVKPFGVSELLARIRALLRRSSAGSGGGAQQSEPFFFADVQIDPQRFEGKKRGSPFSLSARELELLALFLRHPGQVLSRARILDEIWGIRYEGTTRTLDQHIANLRKKIEDDPARPRTIVTVHRVGYRFDPPVAAGRTGSGGRRAEKE